MMTNVCRIFNDKVGAVSVARLNFSRLSAGLSARLAQELVERTGRNPSYMYQSLGCSKKGGRQDAQLCAQASRRAV